MTDDALRAYNLWRLRYELADKSLARLEHVERSVLAAAGCPYDISITAIDHILQGHQPAPWPEHQAARRRKQVHRAMLVLVLVQQTRQHLQFGHENAFAAVENAISAALAASRDVLSAENRERRLAQVRQQQADNERLIADIDAIKAAAKRRLSDKAAARAYLERDDPDWNKRPDTDRESKVTNLVLRISRTRTRIRRNRQL